MRTISKIFIVGALFFPLFSWAQSLGGLASEMTVSVIPSYPRPNSPVEISIEMYTEDLNSALITWYLDGKKVKEGRGLKKYNFTTAGNGESHKVQINVSLQSGESFRRDLTIKPASVDIIWQSNSTVPPFYRGKALFPPQGTLVLTAMPEFSSGSSFTDPKKLIYKWIVNDQVLESQSGYGKNVVGVAGPLLGLPIEAQVIVTDPSSNLIAENHLTIEPIEPSIIFYENNPLYGIIFEKAANSGLNLLSDEVTIAAFPLFMNRGDDITYNWSMNGTAVPDIYGLSATFRKPADASGNTVLSLEAENQGRALQFAKAQFRINFTNE